MLNWLAGINAFKGGPGGLVVAVSYPGGRLAPHQVGDDLELLRVDVAVAVQVEHLQARRKSLRLEWLTFFFKYNSSFLPWAIFSEGERSKVKQQ